MPDREILDDNAEVTARLGALIAGLSDADLTHDLGGGWHASVALAHLAFWDSRIAYTLPRWMDDGIPHVELDDDVINSALERLIVAMEPRVAAELCLDAAKRADAAIARVPDAIASQLIAEGHEYLLMRSGHRGEHIDQIEAALGR